MIDKKLESDIKAVESFLEFWGKFHALYDETLSRDRISKEDEAKFFESKELIRAKYEDMNNSLELKYAPRGRLSDPVSDILAMSSIHFMSERNLKKTNEDWKASYVFLNSILERLKNKRRRMQQFNPVGVFLKRMLTSR